MSNWANQTRAALAAVGTEELKPLGNNFEPITKWYRMTAVDANNPKHANAAQLKKGDSVEGTFEGFFTSGKFKTRNVRIRTSEGLVALAVNGNMSNTTQTGQIDNAADGSTVKITYLGQEPMKTGKFAGKLSHQYLVVGNKRKSS